MEKKMTAKTCRWCNGDIQDATPYDRPTWVHWKTESIYCSFLTAEPQLA